MRIRAAFLAAAVLATGVWSAATSWDFQHAVGDPGMRRDGLRVAIEAWNQCNEVHQEIPHRGSPRHADCFDVIHRSRASAELLHRVTEKDNSLGFANATAQQGVNVDTYAAWKETYLGDKCQVADKPRPWQFWMIMVKSGNMDTAAAVCPRDGRKSEPFPPTPRFPCFGEGCMNMPAIHHDYTSIINYSQMKGSFFGTWDLDADVRMAPYTANTSYFSVVWEKKVGEGSWVFHHFLKTSPRYPWLMMYLMDIGGCWKNNGKPCDGDVTSDVTRYNEMIINPSTEAWCTEARLEFCPPYHTFANGTRVSRKEKQRFPYDAYHVYCSPGNAEHLLEPFNYCDPYSNPQPQEILQILPHPVWSEYRYPSNKGEGWIGDKRTWELDVGRLSQSLYFYQDPVTQPVEREWPSVDIGTEIYVSGNEVAEWTVSDFDIIVPRLQATVKICEAE